MKSKEINPQLNITDLIQLNNLKVLILNVLFKYISSKYFHILISLFGCYSAAIMKDDKDRIGCRLHDT